jgi:hypothetical protein
MRLCFLRICTQDCSGASFRLERIDLQTDTNHWNVFKRLKTRQFFERGLTGMAASLGYAWGTMLDKSHLASLAVLQGIGLVLV